MKNEGQKLFSDLARVTQLLPTPIYWLNINAVLLGANEHFFKTMGVAPEYAVGTTGYDVYPREIAQHIVGHDRQVMDTGIASAQEEPTVDISTGRPRYFTAFKTPIRNAGGKVIGLVGTLMETTAQKEAEEFRLKNIVAEEKMEAMKLLAGTIAHELRTPLMSINMAASTIKSNVDTLIEAYQYAKEHGWDGAHIPVNKFKLLPQVFDNISREVEYSNLFINMLLMNIQELQVQEKDLEIGSLQSYIEQAIARYPFVGGQRGRLHIDSGVDFEVQLVPLLFEHVMFNLIKNGIYYLDAAGKGEIDIWLEVGEKANLLYFQDGGKGIPAEQLENIFKKFYTNRRQGTGVGLNFCKQVMQQLGGDIRCESKEGQFTRFILEFPKVNSTPVIPHK